MRKARLKAPSNAGAAFYHCVSRIVDRAFRLGDEEKEQFVTLMREYERFCGVQVITYCIMSNHFHILVEVPERPRETLGDRELVELLRGLSGMTEAGTIEQRLGWFRERGQPDAAEALKQRVMARMWDVSGFMKSLKGRFTQWYNRRHQRKGTLWEERFKSVLVEGAGTGLAAMAAYIDLNPVRAGLVDDPKDYRWCGYGEALGGAARASVGLSTVISGIKGLPVSPHEALTEYRVWLFGQGQENEGTRADGSPIRRGLAPEEVAAVVKAKGQLPLAEYLRLRVRYFTDGAVLGTREFVNEMFTTLRERFGAKRKDGARRMRYVDQVGLYCLRDLRVRVIGP
jgi:REP element-mobilizing transposase RayT